jgi:hypothetical protein
MPLQAPASQMQRCPPPAPPAKPQSQRHTPSQAPSPPTSLQLTSAWPYLALSHCSCTTLTAHSDLHVCIVTVLCIAYSSVAAGPSQPDAKVPTTGTSSKATVAEAQALAGPEALHLRSTDISLALGVVLLLTPTLTGYCYIVQVQTACSELCLCCCTHVVSLLF